MGQYQQNLLDLKGADIDENSSSVNIHAKGGARETVPLSDKILTVLIGYRTTPGTLLFQDRNGRRIKQIPPAFRHAVDALKLNDGIPDARHKVWFQTLRHTFASWLAQNGVGLHELMKHLRHKNMEMTLRYAHLIPDNQRKNLDIIGNTLNSTGV